MEERTIKIVTNFSGKIEIAKNLPEVPHQSVLSEIVSGKLESFNNPTRKFVHIKKIGKMVNPFVSIIHAAFAEHYPVLLTPDAIWNCISQGFAIHVNENSEKLRKEFVQHENKKEIKIQRDGFVKGNPGNNWENVFSEFSEQIKENIGTEKHGLIVSDFSTTGVIEKVCSEIVLMDAMQKYFDYSVMTKCGIPAIFLGGVLEDWKKIKNKSQKLREIDSQNEHYQIWLQNVDNVLNEFISAFNGTINEKFWDSFYKYESASGGSRVTGWINSLFPYLQNGNSNFRKNNYSPKMSIFSAPTPNYFPLGVSKAPFVWDYLGTKIDMEFVGGIFGASQDNEGTLRPEFGWVVLEKMQTA